MTASNQSRTKPGLLFVTLEENLVTPTQADLDFLIFRTTEQNRPGFVYYQSKKVQNFIT